MFFLLGFLAFDGCYAWQYFAFDGFKKGSASGGDVADFVCQAKLGAACY